MDKDTQIQIYRLDRSAERLKEEYNRAVPDIIKKVELMLIKEICDSLLITLG